MKVRAIIKAGHHSPAFFSRLKHFRFWFWPMRIPKFYCIENLRIAIKNDGNWVWPFNPDCFGLEVYGSPLVNLDSQQLTQINKVGGLAWGLPRKLKYGFIGHKNSHRIGFDWLGHFCQYYYVDGERKTFDSSSKRNVIGARWNDPKKAFAYSLGPYIGGSETLPFDVLIEYEITFH